jgi:hypothetical protein
MLSGRAPTGRAAGRKAWGWGMSSYTKTATPGSNLARFRWLVSYDLWYLWLFFSVCGRASPCYSCKDFITFRRTCIHSRGYDTLYWQEKTYCAVPKWVVLASSETRLGANRIVADCFQTYPWSSEFLERVHEIQYSSHWANHDPTEEPFLKLQWKWYLPCRGIPWYRCTLWPVATLSSVCQAGARVGDLPP